MQLHPGALLKLMIPAAVICAVSIGRVYVSQLSEELHIILDYLPYMLCLVAAFMAHLFNRCRLLLASLGIGAFYWVVQNYLQLGLSDPRTLNAYLALSLTLPVLGLYLLLVPERGIWNLYGLGVSIAFVVLGAICMQLGPWLPQVNEVTLNYYAPRPVEGYVLSLGASLLVGIVGIVGITTLCVRNEDVEAALISAFTPLYLSLALLHVQHISVAMSTAASLCLSWGLLRSSHTMAYRDELTGLPGRRALNERLKMLGSRYSIAMLDVDHFKKFNDTYGHEMGDEVLKLVASRIRRVAGGGTAYRYGGEEFCVVFTRKTAKETAPYLEQVREEIANYSMLIRNHRLRPARAREGSKRRGATRLGSNQVSVTISAGIAGRSSDNPDFDSVLAAADKMLYRAKRAGRNRIAYE